MTDDQPYFVLAYYLFAPIDDPKGEVAKHKAFMEKMDATCRIYISEEGINGQACFARDDAMRYIDWMHARDPFKNLEFKIHTWHEQAFPRLCVKYRKRLVGRDREVDFSNQGEHVAAERWNQMLKEKKDTLLLDVRNDYEWKVGRFEGAVVPPCKTFRDFEKYAEDLKEKADPKKQEIMMYCTGGIRCEVYSALLKDMGFEKVYQLQGGIIKYGLEKGSDQWKGKLFVFDDRLTVPISDEPTEVIGKCHHCGVATESYYNCANMDCNELILLCPDCVAPHKGCCQKACEDSGRLRPFTQQGPHKPFRRKHLYPAAGEETAACALECRPKQESTQA